jgi:hypothetical protein
MCKNTKAETVVHPAGQDWANAPVVFPGPFGWQQPDGLLDDGQAMDFKLDRLSAPPRATRTQKVGLVLGTLWSRLCGRSRWLSCAILIAAAVIAGIGVAMEQLSHLIPA